MKIAVIGAGAAGLLAAAVAAQCRAAEGGGWVRVFEKNRKAGVKILMSGGTRCNLTHDCGPAGIMEAFGRGGRFLRQALAALPPAETVRLFNRLGVATKVESTGKIFPASDRALDVRDALLRYTIESGAQVHLGTPVQGLQRHPSGRGFVLTLADETIEADRVIVTVGGKSWPGCGTTGDGYGWLSRLGHRIIQPRPALVPLVGGEPWMHEISGVTLDDVAASVWAGGKKSKKPLIARRGGFLFTHFGFSGPVPMDVSGTITEAGPPAAIRTTLDFLPDRSSDEVARWLAERRQAGGGRRVASGLAEFLPRRAAEAVAAAAGAADRNFAELTKAQAANLGEALKRMPLSITGTRGFDKAEVTAGGVDLDQVDPRTMHSRLVPDLFIAGEILNLDGWIGGYNFQSAFSTGHLAGNHAALDSESSCLT